MSPLASLDPPLPIGDRLTPGWVIAALLLVALTALCLIGALQATGLVLSHPITIRPVYILGLAVPSLALGALVVPRMLRIATRKALYTLDGHGFWDHRSGEFFHWESLTNASCNEWLGHVLLFMEHDGPVPGRTPNGRHPQLVYISGWNINIPGTVLEELVSQLLERQKLAA